MMRSIIVFIYLTSLSFQTIAQKYSQVIPIHIKSGKDSVKTCPIITKEEKVFTPIYTYDQLQDSQFVYLWTECCREGMDPSIKCRPHYRFVDNIADGIYKIVLNGKPVEIVSFVNGKRKIVIRYRRQFGIEDVRKKTNYTFIDVYYDDNEIFSEHFVRDQYGRFLEYRPIMHDQAHRISERVHYFLDNRGNLKSIELLAIGVRLYFSQNGKYLSTALTGVNKKEKERYLNALQKLQQDGLVKNKRPERVVKVKSYDKEYQLNFKSGVLLNWQFINHNDSTENTRFDKASNKIVGKQINSLKDMLDP